MSSNKLLAHLSRADARLLQPHLEAVDLPARRYLQVRNRKADQVYFIESGVAVMVANDEQAIEVGMIGCEGMSGLSVLLGCEAIPAVHNTFMQIAGSGQRMSASGLKKAMAESASLRQVLLRYVHDFVTQVTETALANGCSNIEERLSRWLLMAHDRVGRDEIPLTHEFLSSMLGVRRSGVTIALQELERRGMIAHRRSFITIVDREGLTENANGTYSRPKDA